MANSNRKHRRGLSSVVGAVFMILVMIGALNVILLALQQQDKVTQAVVEKSNSSISKLNEEIKISEVRVTSSNKLNMTVTNTGGATAKLVSAYIVNETASPKTQYRYDLNNIPVDGRVSVPNVGSNLALNVKNNMKYSIKIVTASGNTATAGITPISQVALPMSLTIIPPTVVPGANVTVLFTVTNNLTDYDLPIPLTANLTHHLSCTPEGVVGCQFIDKVTPTSQTIRKGSTAIFQWITWVNGPDATVLTFNASLINAKSGNFVITKSNIAIVSQSQGAFQAEQIVGADLLVKPEIFPIFPGPFGESSQQALWGVSIANPVNQTMKVSRIVFTLTSPDAQGNQFLMIYPNTSPNCAPSGGAALVPIYPNHGTWSCPGSGIMMWRDTASPEQIAPYSSTSFIVRVQPGLVASDEPAFITGVTVFTSYGQFAKTGYAGNMKDGGTSIGNVYLTDTGTPATALLNAHMLGNYSNLRSGQAFNFHVTIADLDTVAGTKIKSGTSLIINVPQGFTNIILTNTTAFTNVAKETFTDGSTQIRGDLINNLGGVASAQAKILEFTATPPAVVRPTVFILHVLSDGVTTDATPFSVDAFGGFALVVRP